jgi:hypothetical protein
MLLDTREFLDEQAYPRRRLARALLKVAGNGTLAGLRVSHHTAIASGEATRPEEIRVDPGVVVDRLGRLIELPRPACLGLPRPYVSTSRPTVAFRILV